MGTGGGSLKTEITTTAIAQWYGSNRILAETVGIQLGKCDCGGTTAGTPHSVWCATQKDK